LFVLPLLIGAELIVHRRLRVIVAQFRERSLIAPEDRRSFEDIIAGTMQLRNSVVIEVLLLVIAFVAFYWLWRSQASLAVASWYAAATRDEISFTWAGYWYVFVSVPILRFILLRWYFRLFIWYVFLFRVARLRLQLDPLHPDQAGGLEFLNISVDAIAPVLIAQSAFLAGLIGNQIWHAGATLPEFQLLIGGFAAFLMVLVLLPLLFFAPQMAAAKRATLPVFGAFAARYARDFRQKWLRVSPQAQEMDELGTGDIQSLADLANSYVVVRGMRALPFGRNVIVRLAVLIALPLLPLALTIFPFEVFLQELLNLLL